MTDKIICKEDELRLRYAFGAAGPILDLIVDEVAWMLTKVAEFERRNPDTLSNEDALKFGAANAEHFQRKWSGSKVFSGAPCLVMGGVDPDATVCQTLGRSLGGKTSFSYTLLRQFILHLDNNDPLDIRHELQLNIPSMQAEEDCMCRRLAATLDKDHIGKLMLAYAGGGHLFRL